MTWWARTEGVRFANPRVQQSLLLQVVASDPPPRTVGEWSAKQLTRILLSLAEFPYWPSFPLMLRGSAFQGHPEPFLFSC
jgi:hypothetical protein